MKFTKDLAAVHGYLCGDGYVVKNPPHQKKKYYRIGLRNKSSILLNDFQRKCEAVFNRRPHITTERCEVHSKEIYYYLTKEFSYYSYEWKLPSLPKENLKAWLRAFFDCEGWVENQAGKSRLIGLECCNHQGIFQIQASLETCGLHSQITKRKGRTIWRLTICGKEQLERFQQTIGFLHPDKQQKLQEAITSYRV
ncbi:MAG: LAGLIDADG family homing endonuclease, partial [Nanoarchaeota archaeon]|nr:LAGLIDADG family homing endonuclease [Nanoarchaeota archaeon]